jgi:hypothetical protein
MSVLPSLEFKFFNSNHAVFTQAALSYSLKKDILNNLLQKGES